METAACSATLRSLFKLALPIGSRLLTGRLETPVSWVCHLRTRPPLFADLEGGELVLVSTSTLAAYSKPLTLETVIEELTRTKASALGVRGTLTPRAHQMAKSLNFPVIALPERVVLPQVERAVQRFLQPPGPAYPARLRASADAPAPCGQLSRPDDDAQRPGPDARPPGRGARPPGERPQPGPAGLARAGLGRASGAGRGRGVRAALRSG